MMNETLQFSSESGATYTLSTEGVVRRNGKLAGRIAEKTAAWLIRKIRRAQEMGEAVEMLDVTRGRA